MANLFDYLKNYGKYTFFEKEFNEIDAAILSAVTYIDFNGIVSDKKNPVSLGGALEYFVNHYDVKKFMKRGFFQKDIFKLAKELRYHIRFRNITLYNYVYDVAFNKQFSAITMILPTKEKIIAYEGTDHNLVGWEEDLVMCYKYPVPAQIDAIKYLNKNINLFDKSVIVLGHSKGGHLATVASCFCNPLKKIKIKRVYNLDGPGLRKREFESKKYLRMSKKIVHIVPYYTFVGLLLRHTDGFISIKSNRKDIIAHSVFAWEVSRDSFLREPLSKLSTNLDKSIIMWLEMHNDYERERIIKDLFDYFRKSGIKSVTEFASMRSVISLIRNSGELDKETMEVLGHFIKFNFEYHIKNKEDTVKIK